MFSLVGNSLMALSFFKYIVHYPILLRNSKHNWLFLLFLLIIVPHIIISLILPLLLSSLYKSVVLLVAVIPLIPYYLLNKKKIYILVFIISITSNHLTIVLNDGYMPVSKEAVIRFRGELWPIKDDGEIMIKQLNKYKYIGDDTVLPFLGDVIYFPYTEGVSSAGDWILYLGFLIFLLTRIEKK